MNMLGPGSTSSNTRASSTVPHHRQPVNTQTKILDTVQGRILCIADIRGHLSLLNKLAADANAKAIIHTGDFGFCEASSLERINDRTLRHLIMYSPLITAPHRNRILAPENSPEAIRNLISTSPNPLLSEFPQLLAGEIKLNVPVYTVYGACEDVAVIEKFRAGVYSVDNLHVLDEATTRCLDVGGVKLRLFGLGGALVTHKLFDNGDGQATIAGGQGTMWTTALQIGELVDTAQRVYDQSETRVLISHASPGREGILAQLALVVKADLTLSAGLHFRYPISYNEFSVQADFEGFRTKLLNGKEGFDRIWESVKPQVESVLDENQKILMEKALSVIERIPSAIGGAGGSDENAWKNCWNWNLTDASFGQLILDIKEGRVMAELKSQGFNYAYRRQNTPTATTSGGGVTPGGTEISNIPTPGLANGRLPTPKAATPAPPSKAPTPAPNPQQQQQAAAAASQTQAQEQSSTPAAKPATPAPSEPAQANGSTNGDKELSKKEKKKIKDKEKKAADKAAGVGPSKKANGHATEGSIGGGSDVGPTSPIAENANATGGAPSTGTQTPTGRRAGRNPWTLFLKHLPAPVTEDEIKEFFGDARSGITFVKIPYAPGKPGRHIAYVEFGDEDAMKAGLEKKGEKIRDSAIHVSIAEDRDGPAGRGGGRGGRGGFAARGLMAAGLGGRGGHQRDQ